jgi:hypothetical protein
MDRLKKINSGAFGEAVISRKSLIASKLLEKRNVRLLKDEMN